jgi:hypothetical protein
VSWLPGFIKSVRLTEESRRVRRDERDHSLSTAKAFRKLPAFARLVFAASSIAWGYCQAPRAARLAERAITMHFLLSSAVDGAADACLELEKNLALGVYAGITRCCVGEKPSKQFGFPYAPC